VVRHEFGHVLGLAHHAAPGSVMAPVVRATRLAPGDRDALRLLYRLPPGARCGVE
jgi:predicted Zn-dependent protease